jgi:hypothetical protein
VEKTKSKEEDRTPDNHPSVCMGYVSIIK